MFDSKLLLRKPEELSKVTSACFTFPIYKRATTALPCSRQSLVFHTFYSTLLFNTLLLFRHYNKKQASLQTNNSVSPPDQCRCGGELPRVFRLFSHTPSWTIEQQTACSILDNRRLLTLTTYRTVKGKMVENFQVVDCVKS